MPQRSVRARPDARRAALLRSLHDARSTGKDRRTVVAIAHPSAQFSATLRVHLANRPARSPRSRPRSRRRTACSTRSTSCASKRARRCATSPSSRRTPSTSTASSPPCARSTASSSSTSPTGRSCSTSAASSRSSRRLPLKTRDDLSMAYTPGRRARLARDRRRSREGLGADDQAEHRRRRQRRQRGARARRRRPRGGAAGDGGQGRPLQGVRRRRRVPDLPRHAATPTRSSAS